MKRHFHPRFIPKPGLLFRLNSADLAERPILCRCRRAAKERRSDHGSFPRIIHVTNVQWGLRLENNCVSFSLENILSCIEVDVVTLMWSGPAVRSPISIRPIYGAETRQILGPDVHGWCVLEALMVIVVPQGVRCQALSGCWASRGVALAFYPETCASELEDVDVWGGLSTAEIAGLLAEFVE
jgi:hypothetical protein